MRTITVIMVRGGSRNDQRRAKEAFMHRRPVTYGGRDYECIHAIIYRHDQHDKLIVSAELWDRNQRGNSIIIANLKDIT